MFLSYADLGFVSAGMKYAGESYVKGEHKDELKLYGFSGFILFIFVTLIAGVYFLFSYNPSLLIKNIDKSEYLTIASKLLFIQAIFSFSTVLQRYVTGVFQVRIAQFVYQKINIVGSLIKIVSVFYFFGTGKYDIVNYYLFIKIVELFTLVIGIWIIQKKYKLTFIEYLKAFKFDSKIYKRVKRLAFSSLFVTLMWVLYNELDVIVIGKMLGATAVAVFALASTFIKFLRSLTSIIFSPFQNRYNHLVGLNDMEGLQILVNRVIQFTMPIFVLIVISIIILSNNIVLTWAGTGYIQSGIILTLLAIKFLYSFIVHPGSNMLVTLERIKEMYWINIVIVLVFWSGVFLTEKQLGVISFAGFKLLSASMAMLFYLNFLLGFLEKSLWTFLKETVFRVMGPIAIQLLFLLLVKNYLPDTKGIKNLLIIVGIGSVGTLIGLGTLFLTSSYYRIFIKNYYPKTIFKNR